MVHLGHHWRLGRLCLCYKWILIENPRRSEITDSTALLSLWRKRCYPKLPESNTSDQDSAVQKKTVCAMCCVLLRSWLTAWHESQAWSQLPVSIAISWPGAGVALARFSSSAWCKVGSIRSKVSSLLVRFQVELQLSTSQESKYLFPCDSVWPGKPLKKIEEVNSLWIPTSYHQLVSRFMSGHHMDSLLTADICRPGLENSRQHSTIRRMQQKHNRQENLARGKAWHSPADGTS